MTPAPDKPVLVARHAMATRFEIALHGGDPARLRAAGEEALNEIDRLESLLSLYRAHTDIARVNASAHAGPVRVTPEVFLLLEQARRLSEETLGAFDITIAPLVRCWGFMDGQGTIPSEEAIAAARSCVGMSQIELDSRNYTVSFRRPGVMLDLGAIGKGYAIERAAELLVEAGVTSALIHGGTSSTVALGRPPGGGRWKIAITSPLHAPGAPPLATLELENESLSVSAVWGRSFQAGDRTFGHIIDPRTGRPAESALLTAVVLPSATEGDALTTALLTDPSLLDRLSRPRPQMRAVIASGSPASPVLIRQGIG